VHVPFCAHRCGYCDFVTVTGHADLHERYVAAVLSELALERERLAPAPATVFIGGGTPTLLGANLLGRLLDGLPEAAELTVEANPETVDDALAGMLGERGVRVSLGAQSFGHAQLAVLERRATPEAVRAAAHRLRAAGVANLSLDLLFGIPGMGRDELDRDLAEALALHPEHLSCYELEAKPGTRFAHRHGAALARQAELLEEHYEHVIARLGEAGYRWYETANFCRDDRRAAHNLAYWTGRDYLGIGIGAVSTIGLERRTNRPSLAGFVDALERGEEPPRSLEQLTAEERARERLLLGLRLDVPFATTGLEHAIDPAGLERMVSLGLVEPAPGTLRLTPRGRLLANDVVSSVIA
jgi:oxygen-independent coproporphyrinogen-3 oxidase